MTSFLKRTSGKSRGGLSERLKVHVSNSSVRLGRRFANLLWRGIVQSGIRRAQKLCLTGKLHRRTHAKRRALLLKTLPSAWCTASKDRRNRRQSRWGYKRDASNSNSDVQRRLTSAWFVRKVSPSAGKRYRRNVLR